MAAMRPSASEYVGNIFSFGRGEQSRCQVGPIYPLIQRVINILVISELADIISSLFLVGYLTFTPLESYGTREAQHFVYTQSIRQASLRLCSLNK